MVKQKKDLRCQQCGSISLQIFFLYVRVEILFSLSLYKQGVCGVLEVVYVLGICHIFIICCCKCRNNF